MYQFIDVDEVSEGAFLPSEALKINGEYIENQIEGYKTLTVEGREALSPELTTYETGVRDGSTLQSKRYPARTLKIKYQLLANSNEEFRAAFNKLASILNVEEAELIFNDEPDKFFIGTPSAIESVTPGRNSVIGEFEIFCADPFKYSVTEYEAEPDTDENSVIIDYNGTYKAFPTLEAAFYSEEDVAEDGETETVITGNGECGYVAFFNESEKIIQLGDPDEADKEVAYAKSQTLANQTFKSSTAWGTATKNQFPRNVAVLDSTKRVQTGDVAMVADAYKSVMTDTTATLKTVTSSRGNPTIKYVIKCTATNRTEKTVKLKFAISANMTRDTSYFGKPYQLHAHISVGGSWYKVTLKGRNDWWEGKGTHTKYITVTVTGLSASTTAIKNILFKTTRDTNEGSIAGLISQTTCANMPICKYGVSVPTSYYLAASSYGSSSNAWHGPTITRTLPADASGEKGATNFSFSYSQRFSIGSGNADTSQKGMFQANLISADGKIVAGVCLAKDANGKKAVCHLWLNNTKMYVANIDASYYSQYLTSSISKSGSTIVFCVGKITKVFKVAALADVAVTKVCFGFLNWGTAKPLSYNGLYWAKFVKNNCDVYKDVPNKFSENDVVIAECSTGKVYLNGVENLSLGALGNDWEGFCLTPGINQIGFSYSDWVTPDYAPTFRVRYREVFL